MIESQSTATDLAIVLVHGTFARNAEWIRNDGKLSTEIHRHLPNAKIVPFRWSGANSPSARIKAGQELASVISSLHREGRKTLIIGHSHGGNVALYALRDPAIHSIIDGIAFLGTPFLHITKKAVDRFARVLAQTISWLVVFPVYLPYGAMAMVDLASKCFGAVGWGLTLFGNTAIVLLYVVYIRKHLRDFAANRFTASLQRQQIKANARLAQPIPKCPTFVSWVNLDEAGLLLRIVDAIAFTPWQLYGLTVRILSSTFFSFVAIFLATGIYDDTVWNLNAWQSVFMFVLAVPVFVVITPWVIGVFTSLFRGLPIAFGYEGILRASILRIMPSSLPWWKSVVGSQNITHSPAENSRGLRHSSFYDDPKLISELVKWISEEPDQHSGEAGVALDKKESEEIRSQYRRWLLPTLSAFGVIAVYSWSTLAAIENASVPKEDIAPLSKEIAPLAVNLTTVIEIDEVFFTEEGPLNSRIPLIKNQNIAIKPGKACILRGQWEFGNWDSTLNISLHDTAHPDFGKDVFDMAEPNYRKRANDFIDRRIHHAIWEWNSGQGKNVSFRQVITNTFQREGTLLIRLWNKSHHATSIKGSMQMACIK